MKTLKKVLLSLLSLLLLASCAVPMESEQENNPAEYAAASVEDSPAQEAPAENGEFIRLSSRLGTADLASMKLEEIYHLAEDLVDEGKPILIDAHKFTYYFILSQSDEVSNLTASESKEWAWEYITDFIQTPAEAYTECTVLPTDDAEERLVGVYTLFLCMVEGSDAGTLYYTDEDYDDTRNLPPSTLLAFCDDYQNLGYESVKEYVTYVRQDLCEKTPGYYFLSFKEPSVVNVSASTLSYEDDGQCLDKWSRQ